VSDSLACFSPSSTRRYSSHLPRITHSHPVLARLVYLPPFILASASVSRVRPSTVLSLFALYAIIPLCLDLHDHILFLSAFVLRPSSSIQVPMPFSHLLASSGSFFLTFRPCSLYRSVSSRSSLTSVYFQCLVFELYL
jgi:hypothetical protein